MENVRINYKEKRLLDALEVKETEVKYMVEETALQLASDVLATTRKISEIKEKLNELKSTYPLDTQAIVSNMAVLEDYEKGLKALTTLKKELGYE